MYAVCRSAKHSGSGSLGAASQHATRERETPNADPSRRHLNRVVFGAGDPAAEIERRITELQARGVKIRKNGVRAIELVLSASPEFFSKFPEKKQAFYRQSVGWLKSYFGEKNLASVIAHEDESTPHLSVFVLPLDESPRKKGPQIRLNAARWMDGRERLAKMQTSFAQAMAPLGLARGVERSRARHQDVSRWYGVIERAKALTGIDDEIKAVEAVIANNQGELNHLRKQQSEMERLLVQIQNDIEEKKKRIKSANEQLKRELQSALAMEGCNISGILSLISVNGGELYSVNNGVEEKIFVKKNLKCSYDHLIGKKVELKIDNHKLSLTECTLAKVYKPTQVNSPNKGGMSL